MLKQAKEYIARGWKVFPLHSIDPNGCCTCGVSSCSDAGKHPRVRRGLKEASADPAQIEEWFGPGAPHSNVAIATGAVSGITVLDVDIGEGKLGAETWAALIAEGGEPETLMARTGSGGMHFVFQYNSALKTSSNTLGKGVDCRNDGGYIVAPPSRHRSGGVYTWENDHGVAALPAHLAKRKENRGRPRKDDYARQKYTIEQVASMLEKIPPDDRDLWRNVGIIMGREFKCSEQAWTCYCEWSARWGGTPGRNHHEIMREAFYEISKQHAEKGLSVGTIVHAALAHGWAPKLGEVPIQQFVFYGPGNNFIYRPTVTFWIAEAVNSVVSPINENGKVVKPSDWLRLNAAATSMTKDPNLEEELVKGRDCRDGVLVSCEGAAVFNCYQRPTSEPGDARLAEPFLAHLRKVFPNDGDADQFLDYMAHRAQKPGEKPRFALLIAGDQGVGKDTAIEFCIPALGAWNVVSVDPSALDSGFNEYAASVLVRISEAANLHDMNKWAFNERMKVLIAGSPDHVQINPKYGQKYSVRMYCGVIITTNHLTTGIYIPADDRRYDVIECASKLDMGLTSDHKSREYFGELWDWFYEGGGAHVTALLLERDISNFSASNGQRKTSAHTDVVATNMSNDHWLLDAIEELGAPKIVRSDAVCAVATKDGMQPKEVSLKLQPSMTRCGYHHLRNHDRKDGRWKFENKLAAVYVKNGVSRSEIRDLWPSMVVPF